MPVSASSRPAEPALRGREVFCLFPHQTAYVVPATAVTPLPTGLPAARAVLAANMETALNAVWDAAPRAGERIHVIGAGVVGCLVAYLCGRMPGARSPFATWRRSGLRSPRRWASPSRPGRTRPHADLVVHASGNPSGLRTALAVAGFEARIVELSWYGSAEVPLPLGEAFHSRRLTLQSSQVGQVATFMRPRWSHARRMAKALDLLRDPALDQLVTAEVAFAGLPLAMQRLARDPGGALCVRIVYPNRP